LNTGWSCTCSNPKKVTAGALSCYNFTNYGNRDVPINILVDNDNSLYLKADN